MIEHYTGSEWLAPGLFVALIVIGVVLIVVANSRREEMVERVDPYHDPDAGDGHSDPGPEVPHAGDIGTVGVDPHRGWTGG